MLHWPVFWFFLQSSTANHVYVCRPGSSHTQMHAFSPCPLSNGYICSTFATIYPNLAYFFLLVMPINCIDMSPERESMPYCYFKKVAFNHVKNVAHVAKYKF